MAYFVVAGKPDCPLYVHAAYVANYLHERLPNFDLKLIQKQKGDWEPWLEDVNRKNKWYHTSSPVIWKSLTMRGGKAHLIGGLSEFWEYCYDYYNLESLLSNEEVENLVTDNMQYFGDIEKAKEEHKDNATNISIIGAEPVIIHLLPELLKMQELELTSGVVIKLHDLEMEQKAKRKFLDDAVADILAGIIECIKVEEYLPDVIKNCDILIFVQDFPLENKEDVDGLVHLMYQMFQVADVINAFANKNLKVILAHEGSISFSGTILIESCTKIRVPNIVGISADLGLSVLNVICNKLGVPMAQLGAPPVWGFIGIDEFIDIENTVQHCGIYKPHLRAIKTNGGSTLPLGTIKYELRLLSYMIDDPDKITLEVHENRKTTQKSLDRPPVLAKARAIMSLLKLWYAKKTPDAIISLAVCSDGTFEIPERLLFSQPAVLNSKRMWVPCKNFPVSSKAQGKVNNIISDLAEILDRFGIGSNIPVEID